MVGHYADGLFRDLWRGAAHRLLRGDGPVPSNRIDIARDMELFMNMEVIQNSEALEHFELIQMLDVLEQELVE